MADPSDDMASNKALVPKTIAEARTRVQVTRQEVIGYIFFTASVIAFGIASLILYLITYTVPYTEYVEAECLVLNSTQTVLNKGFNREPLYRAEVYVYVFNTTEAHSKCCCANQWGRERCAEWEAVAFDNIREAHTTGDRTEWLRKYGWPGTIHPCWSSGKKDKVLLTRDMNANFLMAPVVALVLGALGIYVTMQKVKNFHQGRYIYMKLSGEFDEPEEEEKLPMRPPTPPSDEEPE